MGLSGVVASIAVIPAALGCALCPFVPLPVTITLFHVAATGFVVATAASDCLAPSSQGILGKKEDGRVEAWGKVIFWPYHLGLHARLTLKKQLSDEPLFHEIAPGWFLGGWPGSDAALPQGHPSVVDCTCEYGKAHDAKRYKCLMVWDTHGATAAQLKEGVDWALVQRKNDHPVYIHCAHGHGRSVALLIACFIKLGIYKSIEEGEAKIKAIRPKIRLNARQIKQIKKWMELEGIGTTGH